MWISSPRNLTPCAAPPTNLPKPSTATPLPTTPCSPPSNFRKALRKKRNSATQPFKPPRKVAADVPLQVAEQTVALFERLGQLEAIVAASMRSDLEVARGMAAAGARGALANVEINLDAITDSAYVALMRKKAASLRERLANAPRTTTA